MYVADAAARVGQIEQMMAAIQAPPAQPAPPGFAAQLSDAAQAAGPTANAPSAAGPHSGIGGGLTASVGAQQFSAQIETAANRNGVDPALLSGLISQESGFDPNAQSGAGAVGLAQLMPGTAAALGVTDPRDPSQSIEGGARYLRQQLDRFGGDAAKALAAYNAGPGAVERYGGVPPYAETRAYVTRVLGYADEYRRSRQGPLA